MPPVFFSHPAFTGFTGDEGDYDLLSNLKLNTKGG